MDTGGKQSGSSTEVLDVHIGYLRDELRKLSDTFTTAMSQMATKRDIEELGSRIAGLATREELRAQGERMEGLATREDHRVLTDRLSALETKVKDSSVPSVIDRASVWIKNVGGAIAIIGGGLMLLLEFLRKVKS